MNFPTYEESLIFFFISVDADRQKDKWTDRQLTDRQDDRERDLHKEEIESLHISCHSLPVCFSTFSRSGQRAWLSPGD
jgi:hypothetical protein